MTTQVDDTDEANKEARRSSRMLGIAFFVIAFAFLCFVVFVLVYMSALQ